MMKIGHALLSAFLTFAAATSATADERVLKISHQKILHTLLEQGKWEYEILKYETLEEILKNKLGADNVTIRQIRSDSHQAVPRHLKKEYFFDLEISSNWNLYSYNNCFMEVHFSHEYQVETLNVFSDSERFFCINNNGRNLPSKLAVDPIEIHRGELELERIPNQASGRGF